MKWRIVCLKMFFWRLACTCEKTCESVWTPKASFYASLTCVDLRLLAGPFGQGFTQACKNVLGVIINFAHILFCFVRLPWTLEKSTRVLYCFVSLFHEIRRSTGSLDYQLLFGKGARAPHLRIIIISMRLKCQHRRTFWHKPRLQKCPQVRDMTNLAKTPKSAILGDMA